MSKTKRTYRIYWKPLRNLLTRIDLAVDEYVNRDTWSVTRLYSLIDYHPLNWFVRMHGKRVYDKIHFDFGNPKKDWLLEGRVREAFQLHKGKDPGALKRDMSRIMESIAAPFEILLDKVMVLHAMIREMRKK